MATTAIATTPVPPTPCLCENRNPSTSMNSLSGNSSNRRCAFTRKCARLIKEHRARFYIMRRCVTMLICWRDYDS